MILVGSSASAQQAFSINDLRYIERLISAKDCGALRSFLRLNPRFTIGNDPLAAELRAFSNNVDNGLLNCYTARSTNIFGLPRGRGTRSTSTASAAAAPQIY